MRTEQEILSEFEELGYKIKIGALDYQLTYGKDNYLTISRITKEFAIANYMSFTMKEFKLLHELFECWGWL